MKYAMLSFLIPDEQSESYKKNVKHTMQDAASALQWNIYNGLSANLGETIPLFNIMPVDSFPQYYKYPFIFGTRFGKAGQNIGFCNVKLLRNYHKTRKIYKVLCDWCQSEPGAKTLFVYTIAQPFLKAVWEVKKKYPELRVCAIVADLPNMSSLSSNGSLLRKIYVKHKSADAYQLLSCVDGFVLLTKQMADYMNLSQPYCVMEGIASDNKAKLRNKKQETREKVILYSGTLHRKFGVMHLVKAFREIKDEDFELVICGIGDSEDEIRKAAREDSRIRFMGQLSREDVLTLQQQATILVNPRLNNEEFTKYSFPSKTMEYLASGVPVVAYKLDGIPEEYAEYIIYPQDETANTLSKVMRDLCMLSHEERNRIGQAGREFVLENKNAFIQTKKILQFLKEQED